MVINVNVCNLKKGKGVNNLGTDKLDSDIAIVNSFFVDFGGVYYKNAFSRIEEAISRLRVNLSVLRELCQEYSEKQEALQALLKQKENGSKIDPSSSG